MQLRASADDGSCQYDDASGVCGGDCLADLDEDGICDDVDPALALRTHVAFATAPVVSDCGCEDILTEIATVPATVRRLGRVVTAQLTLTLMASAMTLTTASARLMPAYATTGEIYECGCSDLPEGDCDCDGNRLTHWGFVGVTAPLTLTLMVSVMMLMTV